jgi:hypothetical protein
MALIVRKQRRTVSPHGTARFAFGLTRVDQPVNLARFSAVCSNESFDANWVRFRPDPDGGRNSFVLEVHSSRSEGIPVGLYRIVLGYAYEDGERENGTVTVLVR